MAIYRPVVARLRPVADGNAAHGRCRVPVMTTTSGMPPRRIRYPDATPTRIAWAPLAQVPGSTAPSSGTRASGGPDSRTPPHRGGKRRHQQPTDRTSWSRRQSALRNHNSLKAPTTGRSSSPWGNPAGVVSLPPPGAPPSGSRRPRAPRSSRPANRPRVDDPAPPRPATPRPAPPRHGADRIGRRPPSPQAPHPERRKHSVSTSTEEVGDSPHSHPCPQNDAHQTPSTYRRPEQWIAHHRLTTAPTHGGTDNPTS